VPLTPDALKRFAKEAALIERWRHDRDS